MAGFVTIAVRDKIRDEINTAKEQWNAELISPVSTGEFLLALVKEWRKTRGAGQPSAAGRSGAVEDAMRGLYGTHGPDEDVNASEVRQILGAVFDKGFNARGTE